MNRKIIIGIFSMLLVAAPNLALAGSNSNYIKTTMISPALSNPVTGKERPEAIKICNDSKMLCIPGVDTCCGGGACPSDGVCP